MPSPAIAIAESPKRDTIAVVLQNGRLQLLDARTLSKKAESEVLFERSQEVKIAWSPEGDRIAVATERPRFVTQVFDRNARLSFTIERSGNARPVFLGRELLVDNVDALAFFDERGQLSRKIPVGSGVVRSLAVATEAKLVAVATTGGEVRVFKLSGGDPTFTRREDLVSAVGLSPDGSKLVTVALSTRVIDLAKGQVEHEIADVRATVDAAVFARGSLYLASHDSIVSGRLERYALDKKNQYGPAAQIEGTAAFVSADGQGILAQGTSVFEVDRDTLARQGGIARHGERVAFLSATADGKWLLSSGKDGLVLLWDLSRPKAAPEVLTNHKEQLGLSYPVAVSVDGRFAAFGSFHDGRSGVSVIELPSKASVLEDVTIWHPTAVRFSADGQRVWISTVHGELDAWNLDLQERERALPVNVPSDFGGYVDGLALSSEAFLTRERSGVAWDDAGPGALFRLPGGRPIDSSLGPIDAACRLIATKVVCPAAGEKSGSGPRTGVDVRDPVTAKTQSIAMPIVVGTIAVSPDEKLLAVFGHVPGKGGYFSEKSDLFVEVYSAGGGPALASITDSRAATSLAVTNDRRVFIGAVDGSVSVWSP